MSQAYRLGFELSPADDTASVADSRWSLGGLDPAARLHSGSFEASDGAAVPYRLWAAPTPRAQIVLLHGACDYCGAFDEIGPLFAARGFNALAIDQRGFGATSTRGRWRGKNRMIRDAIEAVIFLRMRYGDALPVFILGESMGAALAAPNRPVVAISGDGGFNMTLGELETARRTGCGLTVIVVNNAASGYVKALQHAMMGGRYQSADLNEMDYAAIARTMGCGGIRVEDPEALSPALRQGMEERDRPTIIDVVVTRDPAQMLPAVDNRTVEIKQGDRVA